MRLSLIKLPKTLYTVLLEHAFTNEHEEVIGLLIGDWHPLKKPIKENLDSELIEIQSEHSVQRESLDPHSDYYCQITHISVVVRVDKRRDRVEIGPEQLHSAALYAESIQQKTGTSTCVVGWYHSHPHITVNPSSVDLATQFGQQSLDPRFFGLIVSAFDVSGTGLNTVKLTGFQAEKLPSGSLAELPVKIQIHRENDIRSHFGSRTQVVHQLFNEAKTSLKQKLETLPMISLNRHLGLIQACTSYNNSLWAILMAFVYPAIESVGYTIKYGKKLEETSELDLLNETVSLVQNQTLLEEDKETSNENLNETMPNKTNNNPFLKDQLIDF